MKAVPSPSPAWHLTAPAPAAWTVGHVGHLPSTPAAAAPCGAAAAGVTGPPRRLNMSLFSSSAASMSSNVCKHKTDQTSTCSNVAARKGSREKARSQEREKVLGITLDSGAGGRYAQLQGPSEYGTVAWYR
ncbi:hypothetical protein Agub_g9241 [Astrephomene gubernaculifera]|uniref:Uncharacterized protein n=1 Tax=Astrephomene gubernaculifera TaxID=47775 RepID=A0AAD3HNT9_9CHLO|nr:hypothetical protein Agub_g9241 [Astrephomene gubernaculifera]